MAMMFARHPHPLAVALVAAVLVGSAARAAPTERGLAAAPEMPRDTERRASALLLLERPTRLRGEEIIGEYVFRWRAPGRVISARQERILADLGDALGIIRSSGDPIPAWVSDKAARATWQWAGAAAEIRRHRAHLLIEVRSPRGDGVANARRLTHLVGAVIASVPVLAVLWSDAGMFLPPTKFLADSEATGRDGIPTALWLNFLPAALSPHLPVVHTRGLSPLGFRELVLFGHRAGPERAMATLMLVADGVLQGRLKLRPGDTFRTSAKETLDVDEIPAPWNTEEMALQLTLRATGRRR